MSVKRIISKNSGEQINFDGDDLPMLIHGADHAGASLFSVSVMVNLFLSGQKIIFFTAFPMAREEFISEISDTGLENDILVIESSKDLSLIRANRRIVPTAVIIKSGDSALCLEVIKNLPDIHERIIFIKNIESILTPEILTDVINNKQIILSGDIDKCDQVDEISKIMFKSKIFFSSPDNNFGLSIPPLEKHVGYSVGRNSGLVTLKF